MLRAVKSGSLFIALAVSWAPAACLAWQAARSAPPITADLGAGVFLVAAPDMPDPRFREAVILIVAHSAHGAHGFIVNRPTELTVHDAFPDTDAEQGRKHQVYFGGPVAPSTFALLHRDRSAASNSAHIISGVYLASSRQILQHLISRADSQSLRTVFGYAGWAPGQLEREVATGSWDVRRASSEQVFSADPAGLWRSLSRRPDAIHAAKRRSQSAFGRCAAGHRCPATAGRACTPRVP